MLLTALAGCSPTDGRESPGDKREWSILQGHEFMLRQNVVEAPRFVQDDDYILLVVPSRDKTENIWIMLAPKSPPFYKQMPGGDYVIPRNVWDKITRQNMASSTVEEVLRSHVPDDAGHGADVGADGKGILAAGDDDAADGVGSAEFPRVAAHAERMRARPSVRRLG